MLGSIVGVTVISCIVIGVIVYVVTKPAPKQRDIFLDFKHIKKALMAYHTEKNSKCSDIKLLHKKLGSDAAEIIKMYTLDPDEKFLILNQEISKDRSAAIIEKVGGASYVHAETNLLHLSLYQFKMSKQEPEAVITYYPKDNITTTTRIEWKSSESKVDDKEIKAEEWVNKMERYNDAGAHVVSLRVQDKNDNWSEWTQVVVNVAQEKGMKAIASGSSHFFRLSMAGMVDGFGKNKYGQLGDGNLADYDNLKHIPLLDNVAGVSAGDAHSLFKLYDGHALACGSNDFGQLGNGSRNNSKSPQKIWGLEQVKQLAAGPDYSAAVLASGAVMTWGNNEFGQLGESGLSYRELPKRVKDLTRVKQISLSSTHVACVLQDGTVFGWGDNSQGQLGGGFKGKPMEPVLANVAGVFYVAAGKNFTIFVLDNGKVKGVGHNHVGQLGVSSESVVLFPKEIPDLKSIVKAVAYDSFVVAMSDIGEVFTWGRYSSKEGDFHAKPEKINGLKYVKDIACSTTRGYALLDDGRVARWSSNIDLLEYTDDAGHFQ